MGPVAWACLAPCAATLSLACAVISAATAAAVLPSLLLPPSLPLMLLQYVPAPCLTGVASPCLFVHIPHPCLFVRLARWPQEFKIQNMVGSCDVKFPIRLEGLASTHAMFCSVRFWASGRGAHPSLLTCDLVGWLVDRIPGLHPRHVLLGALQTAICCTFDEAWNELL